MLPPVTPAYPTYYPTYPTYPAYPAYVFQHLYELVIFQYYDVLKEGRLHTLFKKGLDEMPSG